MSGIPTGWAGDAMAFTNERTTGAGDDPEQIRQFHPVTGEDRGQWQIQSIPSSWKWIEFSELFNDVTTRMKLPQSDYREEGAFQVIDQGASSIARYSDRSDLIHPGPYPIIVFGDHTRCVKWVSGPFVQGADGVKVLAPNTEILHPKFAFWSIRALDLPNKGYSRHFKFLRASFFPVPPLPEQCRIVAKIEALMARSRKVREALADIPSQNNFYRQSVLAAAFRGELTEDWRKNRSSNHTSGDFLIHLETIRKNVWKEHNRNGRKYSTPVHHDAVDLPRIPDSWSWTSMDTVCSQVTDGEHIQPPYVSTGLPLLTAKHVRDGYVIMEDAGFISASDFQKCIQRCEPQNGDILIVSVGATTGRAAIVSNCPPFAIVRSALLLKPLLSPNYLLLWLQSSWAKNWMSNASGASAQPHLYINDTKRMPVPIPTIDEQEEIIRRIEVLFAHMEAMKEMLLTADEQLKNFDQSILAKAFRGELVPQDPSDEPAEVLLARIRAAREVAGAPARRTRTPKPAASAPSPDPCAMAAEPPIPHRTKHVQVAPDLVVEPKTDSRHPTSSVDALDAAVLRAFRQALSTQARWDSDDDLLRAVAQNLGFQRLGSRVKARLKGHLRGVLLCRIAERQEDGTLAAGHLSLNP